MPAGNPPDIVLAIREADRRARRRAHVTFGLTWLVLVGALVAALAAARKIDPVFIAEWLPYILGGVPLTIFIAVASILLAIVFALLGALGRISRMAPIYAIASLYVSLVRGTHLIVQILFVYLALPQIIPETARIPTIVLGILALAFNYGAYMTEIFRAGIQAVPRGQREAAEALGMPERLELVIPGLAEGETQLPMQLEGVGAGDLHGVADAVLGDDRVAEGVGLRVEDAEVRGMHPAAAVGTEAGILGHLEAQVLPPAQGAGDARAAAALALPDVLGALRPGQHRLVDPLEGQRTLQGAPGRPLDVRAECTRR